MPTDSVSMTTWTSSAANDADDSEVEEADGHIGSEPDDPLLEEGCRTSGDPSSWIDPPAGTW